MENSAAPANLIFDTNERDFERAVLERSKEVPVVVDFWAPWCGPCRTLGPLLERLVAEQQGNVLLAKVNVDENQRLAAAFSVQSIPLVLGFRDGKIAAEFLGALPESGVRDFLERLLPSEADKMAESGDQLLAAGKTAAADATFRRALELDPRSDRALIGLARVLSERNEEKDALELLERVAPGTELRQEADRLAAAIRIRQSGSFDEPGLRARIEGDGNNLDARFELAQGLAASGRYDEALREYLEIVRRDRSFRDDGARKAMLDVFELLGSGNEIVDRYRSDLAKVLFS
jgi:putative thioredoxin